jgi:regulatory protein
MNRENGGERDSLAPVIPLFGGPVPQRPEPASFGAESDEPEFDEPDYDELAKGHDPQVEAAWAALKEVIDRGREERANEVEPGPTRRERDVVDAGRDLAWHPTWTSERARREAGLTDDAGDGGDAGGSASIELAEKALLKKLRTRSLSVSEARGVLREHELDDASVEGVLASMNEYGYLDDAALAEQLVHVGVDRKGQGRQLIAQTLAKRGIPRDVADAALAELPDDDLERALEFARGKARSLRSLDRDTALRRLSGQLARRGYGGSLAMTAARIALEEGTTGSSGVRFR